jgi:hypothetical protein
VWWEPAAGITCTPLATTPAGCRVLQKPWQEVSFIGIDLRKSWPGLLPRLGLLTLSIPFFSRDSFLGYAHSGFFSRLSAIRGDDMGQTLRNVTVRGLGGALNPTWSPLVSAAVGGSLGYAVAGHRGAVLGMGFGDIAGGIAARVNDHHHCPG